MGIDVEAIGSKSGVDRNGDLSNPIYKGEASSAHLRAVAGGFVNFAMKWVTPVEFRVMTPENFKQYYNCMVDLFEMDNPKPLILSFRELTPLNIMAANKRIMDGMRIATEHGSERLDPFYQHHKLFQEHMAARFCKEGV